MPRSSSRRKRPLPLGLLLLVFAIGWVYNRFFAPPQQPASPNTPPQSSPRRTAPPRQTQPDVRLPTYSPSSPALEPRQIEGTLKRDVVIKVTDGDTVKLRQGGSIRLIGVDTPEKAQPGGREAAAFATSALMGKTIEYELCAKQPTDRYGRGLGFIYITDHNGRRILFNSELVRQGYARVYSLRPCTVNEIVWNGYYDEARRERRGLFATLGEVPDAASYRKSLRTR